MSAFMMCPLFMCPLIDVGWRQIQLMVGLRKKDIITVQEIIIRGKGPFINYVTQIWPFFDPLHDILWQLVEPPLQIM